MLAHRRFVLTAIRAAPTSCALKFFTCKVSLHESARLHIQSRCRRRQDSSIHAAQTSGAANLKNERAAQRNAAERHRRGVDERIGRRVARPSGANAAHAEQRIGEKNERLKDGDEKSQCAFFVVVKIFKLTETTICGASCHGRLFSRPRIATTVDASRQIPSVNTKKLVQLQIVANRFCARAAAAAAAAAAVAAHLDLFATPTNSLDVLISAHVTANETTTATHERTSSISANVQVASSSVTMLVVVVVVGRVAGVKIVDDNRYLNCRLSLFLLLLCPVRVANAERSICRRRCCRRLLPSPAICARSPMRALGSGGGGGSGGGNGGGGGGDAAARRRRRLAGCRRANEAYK